jgi:Na+/H+ antiporter NhaD/arsenite permease-like protein
MCIYWHLQLLKYVRILLSYPPIHGLIYIHIYIYIYIYNRIISERKTREERKNATRNSEDKKTFWLKIMAIVLVENYLIKNLSQKMEIENLLQLKIKKAVYIMEWYRRQRKNKYIRLHYLFFKKISRVKHVISVLVGCIYIYIYIYVYIYIHICIRKNKHICLHHLFF